MSRDSAGRVLFGMLLCRVEVQFSETYQYRFIPCSLHTEFVSLFLQSIHFLSCCDEDTSEQCRPKSLEIRLALIVFI